MSLPWVAQRDVIAFQHVLRSNHKFDGIDAVAATIVDGDSDNLRKAWAKTFRRLHAHAVENSIAELDVYDRHREFIIRVGAAQCEGL